MGLKGLKKTEQISKDPIADKFIKGVVERQNKINFQQFKRVTFSLNNEIDDIINKISLLPRTFKVSRSDVVKVAVEMLACQSDDEIINLLECLNKIK